MQGAAWDAIVLAGGRGTRLGGTPKAELVVGGRSLLDRTLDAVSGASRVVVVGEVDAPGAIVVQEEPRFAGPAAAVGAGLGEVTAPWVLVVACDHPFVGDAVPPLLDATRGDGAVAVDESGRRQHLLCVVSSKALRAAVDAQATLVDVAVHRLMAPLDLAEVAVPSRATDDVDTWHDRNVVEGHVDD